MESAAVAQATWGREQEEHPNSAAVTGVDKVFHTLRAELALRGCSLSRTHADDCPASFYVSRRDVGRELAAVTRFLDRVGGAYA